MEPILCSKCQQPTKPKQINTKNGPMMIGECVSGCRNPDKPQYALGTFPPKPKPQQGAVGNGESAKHLASIAVSLAEIASILRLWRDPLEQSVHGEPKF